VVSRADMMDSLRANSISTFGGNPLASTYALANLDYIEENELQHNAQRVGKYLFDGLKELEDRYDVVGEIRGKGLMIGVEMVKDGETKEPHTDGAVQVLEACKEQGLLIGKGGLYGNTLRLAPPLIVTEEDAARAIETLDVAFGRVQGGVS
jgi:4-aminobutyrate aminotransferase